VDLNTSFFLKTPTNPSMIVVNNTFSQGETLILTQFSLVLSVEFRYLKVCLNSSISGVIPISFANFQCMFSVAEEACLELKNAPLNLTS
jgi:hypothetical protein